jgi:hypothetical protein
MFASKTMRSSSIYSCNSRLSTRGASNSSIPPCTLVLSKISFSKNWSGIQSVDWHGLNDGTRFTNYTVNLTHDAHQCMAA